MYGTYLDSILKTEQTISCMQWLDIWTLTGLFDGIKELVLII